jgi:Holliday junction resolvase
MAATPESLVKKKIHALLKKHKAYAVNYIGGISANNGTPDILACLNGRFIAIEAKAGKNKPTDLQTLNLKRIDEAGGLALVINEENLNQLEFILEAEHPRSNYQLFARPLTEADGGARAPTKRKPKEA